MTDQSFVTKGGITIARREEDAPFRSSSEALAARLDQHHGVLLASNYEYPGRYNRWEFGFAEPPLMIESRGRQMRLRALNPRGAILLQMIQPVLDGLDAVATLDAQPEAIELTIRTPDRVLNEEERSRAPSVFSILRAITDLFHTDEDSHLGLYGAFGYDLAFQFEPIVYVLERPADQRDLVLFLADELLITDHYSTRAYTCLLYTSPSPRDRQKSRMPSSA